MAEWLRRWTANPLGSARAGSNPVVVVFTYNTFICNYKIVSPIAHLFVAMEDSLP